jgi:hypothetical protein
MVPENMVSSELFAKHAGANSQGGATYLNDALEPTRIAAKHDLKASKTISADEADLDSGAVFHRSQERHQAALNEVDIVHRHTLTQ